MTVTVKGRVPRDWGDETVAHITRRLQELERALVKAGDSDAFLAPSVPAFGAGTVTGGAGAATSGASTTVETTVETTITDTSWRRRFLVMGA